MPYKDPAARRAARRAASQRSADRARAPERARRERDRAERRSAALRTRRRWPERDCAWAAGLFEGEGTITITPSTGRYTRPVATMTNTDRQIVEFFHERWGGIVLTRKKQAEHHRTAWVWVISNHDRIAAFLTDLAPYWVSDRVRTKADLLAEDIAARIQGSHDADYHALCSARMAKMRALNARGETV